MDHTLIYSWYEQYKTGIFRYALSITKNPALAEDVLHDTFVKLLSGKGPSSPEKAQAWLYRVARNLCYDHLRHSQWECPMADTSADPHSPYAYLELIAALPRQDQEIVTLRIVGGLSHREIGAVLGITAGAAQKRYQRAIEALREMEVHDGTKTL